MLKLTHYLPYLPYSFTLPLPLSYSTLADVLDGVQGHQEVEGDDGKKGEDGDEEEGRNEEEQFHFGADGGSVAASTSVSTNPLPPEAPHPATSSTQGALELTNPSPELTSLGKITG